MRLAFCHDIFEKAEKAAAQRIIAFAHQFIFAISGEEELFQIIAPN